MDEILENVFMFADSAQQFEEVKKIAEENVKPENGRRKVIRNNMDYLMTVIEERHRNADSVYGAAAGGLDIRYSVKECYRKLFAEDQLRDEEEPNPNKIENLESFEVAPTLGVKEDQDAQRGTIKGPGSLLQSMSEHDYFKK